MAVPLVAIIGRPNVGKSTLFNRIIRRRIAIVHDKPGVTRDRNAVEFEWNGRAFMLVDTGGYITGGGDAIARAVSEQSGLAIEEADVVLFLVDVKSGITDYDTVVGDMLLKSGKPVILAVTKVDVNRDEYDVYEFYNLGIGDPYPVSGKTGRGTGDLLDAVVGKLPAVNKKADEAGNPLRIALIGRPNVGKSSIVNSLTRKNTVLVTETPGTTRDSTDTWFRYDGRDIVLIDTAGLKKVTRLKESLEYYSSLRTLKSLSRCDIAAVVIDIAEGLTSYDKSLVDDVEKAGKGLLIVANKWDLVEKDHTTMKKTECEIIDELPDKRDYPILFTSALTARRVRNIFDIVLRIDAARKFRVPTGEFNRFVEVLRFPPTAGDISILYATQVGIEPPSFVFFVNDTRKIRDNVARYIERRLREEYALDGTPVRLNFKPRKKAP